MVIAPAQSSMFERALARLDADPVARSRFVHHYDGAADPMDAATWAARPGSVGPTGTSDPFHSSDDLRRAAFGRSDDAQRRAAQQRLSALQDGASMETDAVRRALEAVARDERLEQWHPRVDTRLLRRALRTRDSRPAMTAAAAALVIAFAGLAVWGYETQQRGSLAVFDRPMSSRDESAPSWVFDLAAGVDSVLQANEAVEVRWLGADSRFNVYGVLGRDGDLCLAVVEPDVGGTSTCTSAEAFATVGIRIEGDVAGREYAVQWGPRGLPHWESASGLSS